MPMYELIYLLEAVPASKLNPHQSVAISAEQKKIWKL